MKSSNNTSRSTQLALFTLTCRIEYNQWSSILSSPQELILSCVSSAHMQVLFNGVPTDEFSPYRGVRQGDPISPYLFVLCGETCPFD
ncbi:putative mitochondrial protein, partial [Mucuna pruriens]